MTTRRSATVPGLLCLLAAIAAPPARAEVPDAWSGCHAGANAGYGWARIGGHDIALNNDIGAATATGVALGGQAGCDRQSGSWVWGVQASLDWADLKGDHPYRNGSGPADRVAYRVKSLATITGRLGHAIRPGMLAYLKAGGAWTRTKHEDSDPAPLFGVPYTGNKAATRNGWLVGFGLERSIGRNLSAFVEYDYMDFGGATLTIPYSDGTVASYSFKQTMSRLGVGLNYRF